MGKIYWKQMELRLSGYNKNSQANTRSLNIVNS